MEALEARLGYTFRDRALLENALMHSSYANENRARGYTSNERLEFLGDSVLGMVTAARLYALYPDMPEGKMSRLRAVCDEAETLTAQSACCRVSQLAVNGRDLMAAGVRPGPGLRQVLNALLEAVITGQTPNEKDALLAAAAQFSAS